MRSAPQERGWEISVIGRVGIVLGLQAKLGPKSIRLALPTAASVQRVAAVKLDSGFRRPHFQYAPRLGFDYPRSELWFAVAFCIQHPVQVVTVASLQLFISLVYARSDCSGLAEIERGAVHTAKLASWDQAGIYWGKAARE